MKNFKYIFILLALSFIACEDDEPVTAGDSDPLNEANVIGLDAIISTEATIVGEGKLLNFTVALPSTFSSDATVTVKVEFDNSGTTLGTATVAAGETTGTGSLVMPSDDGSITGTTILGAANAAELKVIGFLLDELVPETTYTISSNIVDLGIFPRTLDAAGGLNILADWNGAPDIDLDMFVIDRATGDTYESAESGSRFETDLFQNLGRDDGIYDIILVVYTDIPAEGTDFAILMTLPDNSLVDVIGTIPGGTTAGSNFVVATFEKKTNIETGVISYINVMEI